MKLKLYDNWQEEAEKKNTRIIIDIENPKREGKYIRNLSKRQIKTIIKIISKAYVYAEATDLIIHNPKTTIEKSEEKNYKIYIISNEDLDKILRIKNEDNRQNHSWW